MLTNRVKFVTLLPGATLMEHTSQNKIYKGFVVDNEGTEKLAYIKILNQKELLIELTCSLIGSDVGISIPAPLLVKINSSDYPEIIENDFVVVFGSEDGDSPNFNQYMGDMPIEQSDCFLSKFNEILECSAFDEWIANHDRNYANILYKPDDDTFLFIDHEKSIPTGLKFDEPAKSNLLSQIYRNKLEFERYKFCGDLKSSFFPRVIQVSIENTKDEILNLNFFSTDQLNLSIEFLDKRKSHIESLFRSRIDVGQQLRFDLDA